MIIDFELMYLEQDSRLILDCPCCNKIRLQFTDRATGPHLECTYCNEFKAELIKHHQGFLSPGNKHYSISAVWYKTLYATHYNGHVQLSKNAQSGWIQNRYSEFIAPMKGSVLDTDRLEKLLLLK